jgi:SNF2 family DNA or RNA helicase
MDETHKIRNPRTKQTKGILEFADTHPAAKYLLLTGSPIVNNPVDLHTLLCIVDPKNFAQRTRWEFLTKYCYYTRNRWGGVDVYGVRDMEDLRNRTKSYTVRRTKKEVLPFLPDKYYRRVLLEMDEDQRGVYEQMRKDLVILIQEEEAAGNLYPLKAVSVLSQLLRLRQINLEPRIIGSPYDGVKSKFIADLVEGMSGNGEKLVIFTCFEKYVEYLDRVVLTDYKRVILTGNVPVEQRARNVKQFQEDPETRLCIGTVQTMGEGITLTAASNVVFADRWWNPSVLKQAEDRLYRIGQKNAVQVIIPVCEDSIDSRLDAILKRKEKLSDAYLGEERLAQELLEDMRGEAW